MTAPDLDPDQEVEAQQCEEQRAFIELALKEEGRDIYVAAFYRFQRGNEPTTSYCALAYGAHTWLPQTDLVAIQTGGEPDAPALFVPWEAVRRILGDVMVPLGMIPERYEVAGTISAVQIEQLRAEAAWSTVG